MKKCAPIFLTLLLVSGCTSIHRLDSNKYQVISVPQGLRNSTAMIEAAQRVTNGVPIIFKVASGQRLPLKLIVDLPMATMDKGDCGFVFTQDTYVMFSQKDGCLLSPDGQRWASIGSPKPLFKLFGSNHGDFQLGFNSTTNEEPFMTMEIKSQK